MSRLTPAGRRIPIAEVPECTQIYKRSSSAAQSKVDDYSLPGVLRAAESMGYDVRDPQPDGLKVRGRQKSHSASCASCHSMANTFFKCCVLNTRKAGDLGM